MEQVRENTRRAAVLCVTGRAAAGRGDAELDVRMTGVGGTSRWVDGARSAGWGLMAAGRVTCGEAIGNTQTMTGVPAPTLYHRWLGWHAPAMRRAVTVLIAGLIVAVA